MIDVQHLTRRYGAHLAVDDVSFHMEKGEVVGFLGPNGAGKTTTMRMLTGFLPATRAERLEIAGFDVLRRSLEVRRRIGYLAETVPLYGELRVREMLTFQGRLHGLGRRELRQRIPDTLERVGIGDRASTLVSNLSRGLRQRVGLAVALLPSPDVLILDEPTSGLDPLQRVEVRQLIRELAEEHTVLLSSHILAEVESVCPRVLIINQGRLIADGTQAQLEAQLGGPAHVRLSLSGPTAEVARAAIEALPQVTRTVECASAPDTTSFEVYAPGDPSAELGAMAQREAWQVREMHCVQASLEDVFAGLILGKDLRPSASPEAQRIEQAEPADPEQEQQEASA